MRLEASTTSAHRLRDVNCRRGGFESSLKYKKRHLPRVLKSKGAQPTRATGLPRRAKRTLLDLGQLGSRPRAREAHRAAKQDAALHGFR